MNIQAERNPLKWEKLNTVCRTVFVFAVVAAVYLIWYFYAEEIGMGVLLVTAGVLLALSRDTTNALTVILLFTYTFHKIDKIEGNLYLALYVVALIIGIVVHLIRFKPKMRKSTLMLPIIAVCVSFILGGIDIRNVNSSSWWLLCAIAAAVALVFFFFNNTLKLEGDKLIEYICVFLCALGLLMVMQLLTYYLTVPDPYQAMVYKNIKLGWGISNNIGAIFCLTIPATFYFSTKKSSFAYLAALFALIQYAALLFTFSRGAILGMTLLMPVIVIYSIVKSYRPNKMFVTYVLIFSAAAVTAAFYWGFFSDVLGNMLDKGLGDSGRLKIYKEAIAQFKLHPIFGVGFDYRYGDTINGNPSIIYWFHSTYLEALGKLGIIGYLAILWFSVTRWIAMLKKLKNKAVFCVAVSMAAFGFYGLIDTNFFHPIQFIFLIIAHFAVERASEKSLPWTTK